MLMSMMSAPAASAMRAPSAIHWVSQPASCTTCGPTPEAYFGRHLAVTLGLRDRLARALGDARWLPADPDWFRKVALGLGHLVRRCEFTNYCEGLDQRHKQVTCKLWDRAFDPTDAVRLASDGRRRLSAPAWSPPE